MTGAKLHLIHPLGFYLDEKSLKRAGLDYWHKLDVREYSCFEDFLDKNIFDGNSPHARLHFIETGGGLLYSQVKYNPGDFLVFGSETIGLPKGLLEKYKERVVRIPMAGAERSLNLSVAVGIVLFEALRQGGFVGLG